MANWKTGDGGDCHRDVLSSYFDYKLSVSRKYIHILFLITGLANLLLLIPDMTLIGDAADRTGILIVRILFSVLLLGMRILEKRIQTFRTFSVVITCCEFAGLAVFLFMMTRYVHPDFLIQSMGLLILIIIVFFAPNRWVNMMLFAVVSSVLFFVFAFVFIRSVPVGELCAAVSYVLITILLCAVSARITGENQYREFITKNELERMSGTDYLTNTANRQKFEAEATKWISFCKRQKLPLSMVFMDIDNMKTINDQFGHSVGDTVLTSLAQLIQNQLRNSDILARWGGDEFLLLLPNATLENAAALTERLRASIRSCFFIKGIQVTCSFGVFQMKEDSDLDAMIREADQLMYQAKGQGKNNVQWSSRVCGGKGSE